MTQEFPYDTPIFLSNYEHLYYLKDEDSSKILRKIILEQGEECCKFDIDEYEIDEKLNEFREGFIILGQKNEGRSVFRKYSLEGFILFNFYGNDTHMINLMLCGKTPDIKDKLIKTVKNYCIQKQVHEWRVIIPNSINLIKFYQSHGFSQGIPVFRNNQIALIPMNYYFIYDKLCNCINLI